MYSSAKQGLLLAALLTGMLIFSACENDLKKIKEISAKQSTSDVDSTTDVDVIYSDSARVKVHMMSPLLLEHKDIKFPEKDYQQMPHGIHIVFYDITGKESGSIVADSAINHEQAKIIEFHKNVIATNAKGDTYRSEELIWDQTKKIIYSNKLVMLNGVGGDLVNAGSFTSDEKLTLPQFTSKKIGSGLFHVTDTTK